jgi:hypothetical protein
VQFELMSDMNLVFALQRRLAYLAPFTLSLSKGIFHSRIDQAQGERGPRAIPSLQSENVPRGYPSL